MVAPTWPRQSYCPWLLGFKGYLDISATETTLLGRSTGNLRWSAECSNLSRSREASGHVWGIDPSTDPDVAALIRQNPRPPYGKPRLFTLVDTRTMTVALIQAIHPPVAMLLCGSEGGRQRALLCSYDGKSDCLYRETVLQVDSAISEKMHRVDRFQLGLNRPEQP